MRTHLLLLAILAGCAEPYEASAAIERAAVSDPIVTYHLGNVNTVELRSIDVQVVQQLSGGNLTLGICLAHNSVYNPALGIDQVFYDANNAVLSINEPGWSLNTDGTQADGFGAFASHKSANPAGHGGTSCTAPLVLTLSGDPTAGTNAPLAVALHLRFADDCSGWVSNRTASSIGSEASCRRLPDCPPRPPYCPP